MKEIALSIMVSLCALLSVQAQTYQVSLEQVTGAAIGDIVEVDVTADDALTGTNVFSFQLSISVPYNVSYLDLQTVSGDLANGWFLSANISNNKLLIAGAGTTPLSGIGRMFSIRYTAVNPGNYNLSFSPLAQCYFNEGNPVMTHVNGSIQVLSPPNISVSPSSANLVIGEALTLSPNGGSAPYNLNSTNNAVLAVSGTQVTAVAQGSAQITAVDADGYNGQSSGVYTVNTFDLDVGDATGPATQELVIPITLDNPSGANFSAGQLEISGMNGLLLNGINSAGHLLDGAFIQSNIIGNILHISFGLSSAITPASTGDVLLELRIERDGGTSSSGHNLTPNNVVLNQNLTARSSSGYLSFQGLPNLYLSPSTGTMLAGTQQQFTVSSGAQAPLNWQLSNPAVGSIDANGLFTAANGGFTQITVNDALSNSASTQTITINDMELSLIDIGGYIGGEVWLPVVAGPSANNEDIFAYDLLFSYAQSQLTFIDFETAGTLSDGWFTSVNENNGSIQVSAASSSPFKPGGVIGYLRFAVDGLSNGQSSFVSIASSLFNQGDPVAIHANGVITASDASCASSGCTNPYASNYNPNALCEDGSCAFASPAVLEVNLKAQLEGPFEITTGLMRDDLRVSGLVPLNEPYTSLGYGFVTGGGESIAPAVLNTTGADAIVDWVIVEIRDANNPSLIVASKSALIQRDGDVVNLSGSGSVDFQIPVQPYYVSLAHRNHLQIMSATALSPLTLAFGYDMSAPFMPLYGTEATRINANVRLMWAGDVSFDSALKYTGSSNDRDAILVTIGGSVPTATSVAYSNADVNMDGVVKYTGAQNDRDVILVNIGGSIPTAVRMAQLP